MTQPTRSQLDAMRALPAAIKAANNAAQPLEPCPFCGSYGHTLGAHRDDCYFTVLAAAKASPPADVSLAPELLAAWNRRAEPKNGWADLWYFVMDEAPLEFERIVTTVSPARWHQEAHKLMRERYPSTPSPLVGADGGTTQGDTQHANQDR